MVYLALLLARFDVEFVPCDNRPTGFGHDPERRDPLVATKVVPLRHILVSQVNVHVRILLCALFDLVVKPV